MSTSGGSSGGSGAVSSVFTRTGAVTATTGDYTAAQVGAVPASQIVTSAGPPTAVTPGSIGQLCVDTTNGGLYQAQSTTTGDWAIVGGQYGASGAAGTSSLTTHAGGPTAYLIADANDEVAVSAGAVNITAGGVQAVSIGSTYVSLLAPLVTAGVATVNTQSFSSGSAFTPNANADVLMTGWISHAGTLTITMGPTTGAENTLWSAVAVLADSPISWWVPGSWLCVITLASSATMSNLHKTLI